MVDVSYSPDSRRIAASGVDGYVRVWDADTGQPIGEAIGTGAATQQRANEWARAIDDYIDKHFTPKNQ